MTLRFGGPPQNPSGLSRPNFYLDTADRWRLRRNRWFEVQLERLAKIGQGFLLRASLAGDIQVQARRNEPVALAQTVAEKGRFI